MTIKTFTKVGRSASFRALSAVFALCGLTFSMFFPMTLTAQNRQLTKQVEIKREPQRIALVIGNGDYTNARKLANPVNDATDMAKTLKELGFEVISGTNLNLKQMTDKVREFGDTLKVSGGVGLFYYAGHGIQANNKNYLIPVEADISREDEIDFAALNFDIILRKMATANNGLNIVVLDACRNNPFARSWSRSTDDGGLAQVTAPTGTFIAYATSPDRTASDGDGRNGLYTSQLLKFIKQPNVKIEEAFKGVTIAVDKASGGAQIPWTSSSLRGEFYFKTTEVVAPVKDKQTVEPEITAKTKAEQEREAWDLVKNSASASDFRYYLEEFPDGANAARAKIRLEELVWQTVRGADATKIQAYLNEFPNGANAAAARIRLRQLEAVSATTTPTTTNNPSTAVTRGTVRKNSIGMELVYIPAGDFMMGSNDAEIDEALFECKKYNAECKREYFTPESPKHKVSIKDGFWMGKYEVTQAEWQAVMGDNPSNFKDCGGNCPVEKVSWDDIQVFLKRLNAKNDGFEYSLPSEAQWEYAARGGTTTAFAFGDSLNSTQANFDGNYPYASTKGNYIGKTVKVGSYQSNAFGLYDMHGNVWEWVQDVYNASYQNLPVDGSGNMSVGDSSWRVLRGGSWYNVGYFCRSAIRDWNAPANRNNFIGFRLVARARSLP